MRPIVSFKMLILRHKKALKMRAKKGKVLCLYLGITTALRLENGCLCFQSRLLAFLHKARRRAMFQS